jgi:hypothetical protein
MLRITKLLVILLLMAPLASTLAWAQMTPANPVPPQVMPQWTPVKGVAGVHDAPNLKTDLFRYAQSYYYYNQGQWYQGESPQGPWRGIHRAPPPFYRIRASYFRHPPGWAKGKKTGWRGAPMPPGQMKKYHRPQSPGHRSAEPRSHKPGTHKALHSGKMKKYHRPQSPGQWSAEPRSHKPGTHKSLHPGKARAFSKSLPPGQMKKDR